MRIKKIQSVYFSGTDSTKKIVSLIAQELSRLLNAELQTIDFSLPSMREKPLVFSKDELVVFGVFVVAGRVPNLLLPFLNTIQGNDALAIPVVLYGNRDYGDALIELTHLLTRRGLYPKAAAAFIGEHSFSDKLAKGRPDEEDFHIAKTFANDIVQKDILNRGSHKSLYVPGTEYPYRTYYQPLNTAGQPVWFLKAKPTTNDLCIDCKLCAQICPMGAINLSDVRIVSGTCMKCCACIKKCPANAKHFINEDFLSHRTALELNYTVRKAPELFF
ncbi:MAG: ferredoxin [Clostridia bacterium]|nr:ferredoxin [Clostridia bacterium]